MRQTFRYRLNINQKLLFVLLLIPFQEYCGSYIATAITKIIIILMPSLATSTMASVLVNYIFDLVFVGLCLFVFFDLIKDQYKEFKKKQPLHVVTRLAVYVLLAFILNVIGTLVVYSLTNSNNTSANQTAVSSLIASNRLPMIFLCTVISPLSEELYYRVGWFTLVGQIDKRLAYIVSAFVFGFAHVSSTVLAGNLTEMYQMVPYFLIGLLFAYVYDHEESFMNSYLLHACYNLIACII